MESNKTTGLFLLNLLCFVIITVIFNGLIIFGIVNSGILFYDYVNNYDQFIRIYYHNHTHTSEFKTAEEIKQIENEEANFHKGHNHWRLPFDYSKVQISVWLSIFPAAFVIYHNLKILKLDTLDEYIFLKSGTSIQMYKKI